MRTSIGASKQKRIELVDYQLTSTLASGDKLRVRFVFGTDRWAHVVEWMAPGQTHQVLSSIEGSDADDWPASGPLQEISQHDIENRQVLLGVGMAGKSHWSVSVRPVENGLEFDWACRSRNHDRTNDWMGSTYQLNQQASPRESVTAPGPQSSPDPHSGWRTETSFELAGRTFTIDSLKDQRQCTVHLCTSGSETPRIEIAPGPDAPAIRWAYRILAGPV